MGEADEYLGECTGNFHFRYDGAVHCVVIVTDHGNVDYKKVVRESELVVDTRNATKGITNRKKVVKL